MRQLPYCLVPLGMMATRLQANEQKIVEHFVDRNASIMACTADIALVYSVLVRLWL